MTQVCVPHLGGHIVFFQLLFTFKSIFFSATMTYVMDKKKAKLKNVEWYIFVMKTL